MEGKENREMYEWKLNKTNYTRNEYKTASFRKNVQKLIESVLYLLSQCPE